MTTTTTIAPRRYVAYSEGAATLLRAASDHDARIAAREWASECYETQVGDWSELVGCLLVRPGLPGEERAEWHLACEIAAVEPACPAGEHDWSGDYDLVGGIRENPGCWGHGGGVLLVEQCRRCGMRHERDTWHTDASDGSIYEAERYVVAGESDDE